MSLKCDFEIQEKFSKCLIDNFLIQHVYEDTRVRKGQVSSLLDLVITRDEEVVTNIEYLSPLGKSDYLLLKIETAFEIGECVKKQHIIKPRLNA